MWDDEAQSSCLFVWFVDKTNLSQRLPELVVVYPLP